MRNPFKPAGFDSIISKGTLLSGILSLEANTTTVLDGKMSGDQINVSGADPAPKTTLVIHGDASTLDSVQVPNVTITGTLTCKSLNVSGQLAIKNGAVVNAETIRYGSLIVEPKAQINGHMISLESMNMAQQETAK